MGTITNLHREGIPCPSMSPAGRFCTADYGHERLGLTHIDSLGLEWLDEGIGGTYLSDPSAEMAQAS